MEGEYQPQAPQQPPPPAAGPAQPVAQPSAAAPVPPPFPPVSPPQRPAMAPPVAASEGNAWQKYLIIFLACLFLLFVAAAGLYIFWKWPEEAARAPVQTETGAEPGIGSEIYERSVNPLTGTFDDDEAQVVNPLDDAYQNPFQ